MALFFGLQSLQAYADLRLVRRALPRRRLLRPHRRTAARGDHRREHPAVVRRSRRGWSRGRRTRALLMCAGDGLLPDRLPRPGPRPARGRPGLGRASSASALTHLPADPDADRAARPHRRAGTAALSGFTQSTGYLIAAIGPFGVGVLHDAHRRLDRPAASRCWRSTSPSCSSASRSSRPAYVEDELAEREPRVAGSSPGPSRWLRWKAAKARASKPGELAGVRCSSQAATGRWSLAGAAWLARAPLDRPCRPTE